MKYCDNCGDYTDTVEAIWNEAHTSFRNLCSNCHPVNVFAVHIANPALRLRVIQIFPNRFPSIGTPANMAVLTNDAGEYFSADLITINDALTAAAVNLYGDRWTAIDDAANRSGN